MVEQRGNQRRVIQDGIEVIVVINEGTLDLYITVGTEADISYKHQYEEFTLKFNPETKIKHLNEAVKLSKKGIRYVKGGNAPNVKARFRTQEYKAEISISPKLFVPEEVWKEIYRQRQLQKQMQLQGKSKKGKGKAGAKSTGKVRLTGGKNSLRKRYRPTPYTNTNIARPYSGGRCTPK